VGVVDTKMLSTNACGGQSVSILFLSDQIRYNKVTRQ